MNRTQAARRIRNLRDSIKEQEAEVKELISEHFSYIGEGDVEVHGDYIVRGVPTVRFDPGLARKILDSATLDLISETVPSSKKAKENLAPNVYQSLQKHHAPSVRVILPEEDE